MNNHQETSRRSLRNRHLFVLDVLFGCLTPTLALWLRVESMEEFLSLTIPLLTYASLGMAWKLVPFGLFGVYRRHWRHASLDEVLALLKATCVAAVLGIAIFFLVLRPAEVLPVAFPRSVPILDVLLTLVAVSATRFSIRLRHYLQARKSTGGGARRVLVAGAGEAGSMIVEEMKTNPQLGLLPVGFVDDDPDKAGEFIHGIQVLGTLQDIPRIAADVGVSEVIIAMPKESGNVIRNVVLACKSVQVTSRTIPGVFEILGGTVAVSQIRDVQIEDLLRRGVVKHDTGGAAAILADARVMVTGAGGSIGAELCRQICTFRPSYLTLVGHGENSIFTIAAELRRHCVTARAPVQIHTVIADIRDRKRLDHAFQTLRPQIVFHAAAHKHVGLMESNLPDAVTNNVLGTQTLVDLASRANVERFLMISSDKAVNPISVMGATKRVAELVVREAALVTGRAFVTVRFGNVLGSRGSILPIFKEQIALGGPLTVTHPDAERYFMTIPEAVQLVLEAAIMGKGGEIFVLDMGHPVRIRDLARDLIRLSGLEEGKDINIIYTGMQPGEKLTEELFYGWEKMEPSSHEKIFVCKNDFWNGHGVPFHSTPDPIQPPASLQTSRFTALRLEVQKLIRAARDEKSSEVHRILSSIVPEYRRDPAGAEQPREEHELQPLPAQELV